MIAFEVNSLDKNIHDKKTAFIENEHYKYFNCKKKQNVYNLQKKTIKKELFLTYTGLLKIINTCRKKFNPNTTYILNKWLNNLDKTILNEYNVTINFEENNSGYIYFVTSNLLNAVKIGMWRSNIASLYNRYITVYGKNIKIDYFYTENVRFIEKHIHTNFNTCRITNELFNKDFYDDYIDYTRKYLLNN